MPIKRKIVHFNKILGHRLKTHSRAQALRSEEQVKVDRHIC